MCRVPRLKVYAAIFQYIWLHLYLVKKTAALSSLYAKTLQCIYKNSAKSWLLRWWLSYTELFSHKKNFASFETVRCSAVPNMTSKRIPISLEKSIPPSRFHCIWSSSVCV